MKLQVLENRLVFDGAFGADVFIENEVFDTDAVDHVSAVAFDEQIASDRTEIAVIDTSIDDYETLASNIPHDIDIIYIDGTQDGMAQLETQLTVAFLQRGNWAI